MLLSGPRLCCPRSRSTRGVTLAVIHVFVGGGGGGGVLLECEYAMSGSAASSTARWQAAGAAAAGVQDHKALTLSKGSTPWGVLLLACSC
jgi:hypothetical protein